MSLVLKDRVLETSTSVGTGDFVLDGAQTGYQGFSVVGNGATVPYTIQGKNADGTLNGEWEVGEGTYYSSGNYVSRDLVYESSNSNNKVAFSAGDKDIFLDLPSELISTVAITGSYNDLIDTPNFGTAAFADTTDFATAAQGALADTAVQSGDLGTAAYLDAGVANGVATLDAGGKVPTSQIPQMGDLNYQGTWNATTNTPTLTSSTGTKGYYYVVNVAGTTNLNGITDWQVGDWAVFNGSVWQKIDNTDAVTSVNGYTGTVVLTASDVGATPATSGTSILYGNGSGGTSNVTVGSGLNFTGGTLTATGLGGDVVGPSSATDNALARFDTTTGKLIQNSVGILSDTGGLSGITTITDINYVDFNTGYSTTLGAGQLGWDGNNTLGLGMIGGNVIQHIGEDQFFYCKATSTIAKGQVVMFTGAVGASGVPTGAPATGITDGTYIMGIAAEAIATNGFGLVQSFGTLRNVNTTGYADGDILWYDPSVTGGLTKTKPVAPNVKAQMAAVINGGSSGGGTILIRINPGSTLGGTDSNAQINGSTNGQIITYDGPGQYWKNTSLTAGTAISVSAATDGTLTIANTAPDQVVSLTAGTGISVSGTYPSFTVTNTAPDQVVSITGAGTTTVTGTYPNFTITSNDAYTGTVTSVTGTAPISVATGTTTPVVSMTQASGSTNGWLSSTDWTTFNNKTSNTGTVTSVGGTGTVNGLTLTGTVTTSGSLTLGGTLDLSSPPAIGGTTPAAITGTNIVATAGMYAKAPMTASFIDGIVVDYTTGTGRFSVGTADGYAWYNAGVATTSLMTLSSAGALAAIASITAYSDERLKTNWQSVSGDFVARLANVKAGIYDRTDIEAKQAGVSAQSLQELLPEAVEEQDNGYLAVNYGAAALVSAVELAKKVVELTDMVKALQQEVALLKDK